MSTWGQWIDRMQASDICQYAVIIGKGGGVWAESTNACDFKFPESEALKLADIMKREDQSICMTGLTVGPKKFFCTKVEKDACIFQGKQDNKDDSLVVCATGQAVLVGFNSSANIKTNQVRNTVEQIKDYFISMNM